MNNLVRNPITILVLSFFTMWLGAQAGDFIRKRQRTLEEAEQQEHDSIVNTTLTQLALIVGCSFSMAIGRYDMRKNHEEAEADAIGTEYVWAALLPADDAAKVRTLLDDEAGIDRVKALTCQRATLHTAGPAAYRAQARLLHKSPGN